MYVCACPSLSLTPDAEVDAESARLQHAAYCVHRHSEVALPSQHARPDLESVRVDAEVRPPVDPAAARRRVGVRLQPDRLAVVVDAARGRDAQVARPDCKRRAG